MDWGGVGHLLNPNYFLRRSGTQGAGFEVADTSGRIRPFEGVCVWRLPNGEWASYPDGFQVYDAGTDYLVNVYTTRDRSPNSGPPPSYWVDVESQVRLWCDWASQGTLRIEQVR